MVLSGHDPGEDLAVDVQQGDGPQVAHLGGARHLGDEHHDALGVARRHSPRLQHAVGDLQEVLPDDVPGRQEELGGEAVLPRTLAPRAGLEGGQQLLLGDGLEQGLVVLLHDGGFDGSQQLVVRAHGLLGRGEHFAEVLQHESLQLVPAGLQQSVAVLQRRDGVVRGPLDAGRDVVHAGGLPRALAQALAYHVLHTWTSVKLLLNSLMGSHRPMGCQPYPSVGPDFQLLDINGILPSSLCQIRSAICEKSPEK